MSTRPGLTGRVRSYEDNLGDGWLQPVLENDRQKVAGKLISDLNAKNLYEAEFRLKHSDGTIHWCIANGQPQYRGDGSFAGYIGACVDITESKTPATAKG
ncbi:MAG: PAS domain S-box protein [Bacteroidota bacterium]